MDKITRISNAAKKKIVPSPKLKQIVKAKAEEIRRSVELECEKASLTAEVRVDGSVAKDTWIRDYVDADVFMRVSPELTKKQLREICLPIARKALEPNRVIERFAEHPYVESIVRFRGGSLRVNVVPCYNVQKGDWHSATDRTPYHTEYVRSHITADQHDEVRLLKAFMRGIGSYGADIKTGGFSGMISETLIISHGTFRNVLVDFVEWQETRYIDVENYYEGRTDEVHRIFPEPLVVIDPVDKGRNLGAAVKAVQLWNFVSASRRCTEKPSVSYFFEPKVRPLTRAEFRGRVKGRGSDIVCIAMDRIEAVVDILWSQLYRTQRALANLLESNDFEVINSTAWSDEKALNILLFELQSSVLQDSRKHNGPPVSKFSESSSFISKHLDTSNTIAGPWIENDRWQVLKRRRVTSARTLLDSTIRSGGKGVGVAPLMVQAFKKNARVIEGQEIGRVLSTNRDFGRFMRLYLSGRPAWFA